jgi:phage terminase large subunit-like protein
MTTTKRKVKRYPIRVLPVRPEDLLDPIVFADTCVLLNEKGERWTLSPHQRRVLTRAFTRVFPPACPICRDPLTDAPLPCPGHLRFTTLLWSEVKKSGKTFLAALLTVWWAVTRPNTEVIVAANDLEQAQSRVFQTCVDLIKKNSALRGLFRIQSEKLFVTNGTVVTAIASDYTSSAGARHSLVVFDELWGYNSENLRRLFEELTPPATERDAWMLIVSYAGFTEESTLLETLYQRGLAGTRVDDALEVYEADGLLMFWAHEGRQRWQVGPRAEQYLAEQARTLRPGTFARLHRNEWVSAEGRFLLPEQWDSCVDREQVMLGPWPALPVCCGLDLGIKHDNAALVLITVDQEHCPLIVRHRLWRPSPTEPLNLQAVEDYCSAVAIQYGLQALYVDPFQAHGLIQRLASRGIAVSEFPQTQAGTTRLGQALWDAVITRRLRAYPDPDLRSHVLNAIAVESDRGFRLAKAMSSKKVDLAVALSMTLVAASDALGDTTPINPAAYELSADDQQLERTFITHMGYEGITTHPDYVPDDSGQNYEGRDMRWSQVRAGTRRYL